MPQTVPNRPMKGVALPVVARKGKARESRVDSAAAARRRARWMLSIPWRWLAPDLRSRVNSS